MLHVQMCVAERRSLVEAIHRFNRGAWRLLELLIRDSYAGRRDVPIDDIAVGVEELLCCRVLIVARREVVATRLRFTALALHGLRCAIRGKLGGNLILIVGEDACRDASALVYRATAILALALASTLTSSAKVGQSTVITALILCF